ncbi:MAG: MSMEG_1061 family FMN-dependent PPOX-type flavoprotein [Actinomycetota bacterium]
MSLESTTVTSEAQLAELYRRPTESVLAKETQTFDDACRSFIDRSTFVVVSTSSADGELDASPRGGPAGFVKVLDGDRLAIPDLNGNNRLDSIRNIVQTGRIALLFVVPGLGETLRVNGAASVSIEDEILDLFTEELRRPKTAIVVTIEQGFVHCAKAFRRGGLWEPDTWPGVEERPSPGEMLVAHSGATDVTGAEVEESLERAYEHGLAYDLPESD